MLACGDAPPPNAGATETAGSSSSESGSGSSTAAGSSAFESSSTSGAEPSTTAAESTSEPSPGSSSEDGSGSGDTGHGPAFVEVAALVGIDHDAGELRNPPNCLMDAIDPPLPGYFCGPERYAGGAAAADYDGDGDIDVYVTRPYAEDLLYENRGDGTFVDVAADVGLGAMHTNGAAWADVDNDGDQDLYVTTIADTRHFLYIAEDGAFVEEGEARGAAIATDWPHSGSSVAFGDYDLDGDLDMYVGEWRTHAVGTHPSHARLLRNAGNGVFEDVTAEAGLDLDAVWIEVGLTLGGTFVLSAGWADIDGDDWPDLVLTNDFGTSRLFWNDGDGTFTDGTVAAAVGTDENGMGATLGDFDGDGDLDWFVTSIGGEGNTGNRLFAYAGDRTFVDVTDDADVREGGWGWGTSFFDRDNDADLDLVMTNGWYGSLFVKDPMLAWTNDGTGAMTEEAAALGLVDDDQGRGLVVFDADDDGDLEVLVINNASVPRFFRNETVDTGHWLRIRTPGTTSNRDGIGAKVTVRTDVEQVQEIGSLTHYLGHAPREAHFGLGSATTASVEVYWPASGRTVVLEDVAVDRVLVIEEPD